MSADGKPIRLERSSLFVPAVRRRMIEKAASSAADSVCLDLEDSIAPSDKPEARRLAIEALREIDFGHRQRVYRINATDTAFCYRDVIEVMEAAGDRVDAIMMPKVNRAGDVEFVDRLLSQIEASQTRERPTALQAQIETAAGFLNAPAIAAASPRLEVLILGAGDYSASMQMPSTGIGTSDEYDAAYPGHRWHAVMHMVVASARAHGLRCLDGPYAAYQDAAGFARACRLARSMGFDGKQCIHPSQLAEVNQTFTPSAAEAGQAQRILDAYEAALARREGVITVDGKMVDAASLRMARVVVTQYQLAHTRS